MGIRYWVAINRQYPISNTQSLYIMTTYTTLAIDLGAESGRVMAVHFDGGTLRLEELHRFANGPVTVRGTLHWDFLRLWQEITNGH